jgi:hypothetical protein
MLFLISFVCFGLVMALMALGVLAGKRPLAGSCGRGRDCDCGGVQ